MLPQQEIFHQAIERFTAEQEEVRTAAAFAAGTSIYIALHGSGQGPVLIVLLGNIAVGNLHHFLPLIVKFVEHDQEKRLLSLHAIKEVSRRDAYIGVPPLNCIILRLLPTALMANWRRLRTCSGRHSSRIRRTRKRRLATLPQRAWASLPRRIPAVTSLSFMYVAALHRFACIH